MVVGIVLLKLMKTWDIRSKPIGYNLIQPRYTSPDITKNYTNMYSHYIELELSKKKPQNHNIPIIFFHMNVIFSLCILVSK